MEISIFLAKILGLYLVIVNLYVIIRYKEVSTILQAVNKDSGTLFLVAIITLILGLLLVISHNVWALNWSLIITVIAWLMLIGGLFRLFFQSAFIRANQWWASHRVFALILAIIFFILGLVLTYYGFCDSWMK